VQNFHEIFAHENANFLQNAICALDAIELFDEKLPSEILEKLKFARKNLNFAKNFSRAFLKNRDFTPNLKRQNATEFFEFLEKIATQICGEENFEIRDEQNSGEKKRGGNLIFKNFLPPKFEAKFDAILILQIFLNLFFNAKNHGVSNSKINFAVKISGGKIAAEIENKICDEQNSKKINSGFKPAVHGKNHGLKICEKIAEKINAKFETKIKNEKFTATLIF
jgi:hypothetical protein